MNIDEKNIYAPAAHIVAREIDNKIVIGNAQTNAPANQQVVYSFQDTACQVWRHLDGRTSVGQMINDLSEEFVVLPEIIRPDVLTVLEDLASRKIIIAVG